MKLRRKGETNQGINEINMTSLIDVSLVLVVVLLVATPLAFQSSILVRSSVSAGRQAEVETKTERVEIDVLSADSLVVNNLATSRANLTETLVPLIANSTTRTVIIRCQDGVTHGSFVAILDDVKQCGAAGISILGN